MAYAAVSLEIHPWQRWRYGAKVCVVCGREPSGEAAFPPPWFDGLGMVMSPDRRMKPAPSGFWRVSVCRIHATTAVWPIAVLLDLADEAAATAAGAIRSDQLKLW